MARHTALAAILTDAGLQPARASHIAAQLDKLRLSNLGSDDIAAMLLDWRSKSVEWAWDIRNARERPIIGIPDAESVQWGLFE